MARGGGLKGQYYVYPTASAITKAWKLCDGKIAEYQLLRRHALKLAYWPSGVDADEERVSAAADIDWDWIKTLEGKRIGELRIDEPINGHNNVRVVFFKANERLSGDPMNRIWLLTAFQKNRQAFTNNEIRAFRAMRDLIVHRQYSGSDSA